MDDIAVIEGKILLADDQLEKLPSEIRFDEAHAGEKLLKLNHEKKRFLDCIKVFVCNSKAEMCRLLLKHYDRPRSEEHTSELQSRLHLVCRLLLEKKKK